MDYSTAIVIFREALEIALIVGVIIAATRGIAGRMLWVCGGGLLGIAGAGVVAFFADRITSMADGMGQEVFNALVLFTAALLIGWTVLWMRKHARELTQHLKHVGKQVSEGSLPMYSIALVVALAMLREGSEIVLFSYSMYLSGQTASSIFIGLAVGLSAGLVVGTMLYLGIITIPTRYVFQFTSWLLILLVAGMVSQGIGYLLMAGYFETLSAPVWNSSFLVADGSTAGQLLHGLLGYTAEPSQIQLIAYAITLLVIVSAIRIMDRPKNAATA